MYYSIDVECVATSNSHNDRAVAHVALIDQWESVLLNFYVRPDKTVFSYLYKLTGLSEAKIANGISLDEGVRMVKAALPKDAILVGQNILMDVEWLGLKEGEDFAGMQDLAGLWRVYNTKYNNFTYHSLHHKSKCLTGVRQVEPHDAATDSIISMRLFNLYTHLKDNKEELEKAHRLLMETPQDPAFKVLHPEYDGVCMGGRKTCTCGSAFFF